VPGVPAALTPSDMLMTCAPPPPPRHRWPRPVARPSPPLATAPGPAGSRVGSHTHDALAVVRAGADGFGYVGAVPVGVRDVGEARVLRGVLPDHLALAGEVRVRHVEAGVQHRHRDAGAGRLRLLHACSARTSASPTGLRTRARARRSPPPVERVVHAAAVSPRRTAGPAAATSRRGRARAEGAGGVVGTGLLLAARP
jgi:hypothetical protein